MKMGCFEKLWLDFTLCKRLYLALFSVWRLQLPAASWWAAPPTWDVTVATEKWELEESTGERKCCEDNFERKKRQKTKTKTETVNRAKSLSFHVEATQCWPERFIGPITGETRIGSWGHENTTQRVTLPFRNQTLSIYKRTKETWSGTHHKSCTRLVASQSLAICHLDRVLGTGSSADGTMLCICLLRPSLPVDGSVPTFYIGPATVSDTMLSDSKVTRVAAQSTKLDACVNAGGVWNWPRHVKATSWESLFDEPQTSDMTKMTKAWYCQHSTDVPCVLHPAVPSHCHIWQNWPGIGPSKFSSPSQCFLFDLHPHEQMKRPNHCVEGETTSFQGSRKLWLATRWLCD